MRCSENGDRGCWWTKEHRAKPQHAASGRYGLDKHTEEPQTVWIRSPLFFKIFFILRLIVINTCLSLGKMVQFAWRLHVWSTFQSVVRSGKLKVESVFPVRWLSSAQVCILFLDLGFKVCPGPISLWDVCWTAPEPLLSCGALLQSPSAPPYKHTFSVIIRLSPLSVTCLQARSQQPLFTFYSCFEMKTRR